MSDARAKAEARRAKILARDSSKKVQAIGDDLHLPVEGGPVERPLAKRRQLIESLAEKAENEEEQTTPVASPMKESAGGDDTPLKGAGDSELTPVSKAESTKEVNLDDPEVESIAELEDKLNDDKAAETSAKKKTILKALSPKKSLKEIEAEVARNTAQYDADTMSGEPISKTKRTSKEMNAAVQKTKTASIAAANINPTNVTRLIRMFVIIAMGTYKGYYIVQNNIVANHVMHRTTAPNVVSFDEFGDPVVITGAERDLYETDSAFASTSTTTTATKPSRSWGEWVQYKMTAPFESTLTAVGVSYWIANMLSAGINSRLKAPPKSKGYMEYFMALYQSGFEGILERVFCAIGEYALHLGTILLVTTLLTLYTEIPLGDAAASVANAVSSVVSSEAIENGVQMEL